MLTVAVSSLAVIAAIALVRIALRPIPQRPVSPVLEMRSTRVIHVSDREALRLDARIRHARKVGA